MAMFFFFANGMQSAYGADVPSEYKKTSNEEVESTTQAEEEFKPSYPQETSSGSTTSTVLIIGGVVALGVGALALAGSGGDSGDDATVCETDPVGPSIAGNTWAGMLKLVSNGTQSVTATITQCGRDITITTSTTLEYGKQFVGSMGTNGDIKVYDQVTLEDWTTYYGQASTSYIKIYDKVQNGTKLDSLELSR
jgi:hypothetical protein